MKFQLTHNCSRQFVVAMAILALLGHPAGAKAPCCCHSDTSLSVVGSLSDFGSVTHDLESPITCSSSCCHHSETRHEDVSCELASVHDTHSSALHRCCRSYCQPTGFGGESSCTCEIQPDCHAICNPLKINDSSEDGLTEYILADAAGDIDAPQRSRSYALGLKDAVGKSPGRVHCVALQRWLI